MSAVHGDAPAPGRAHRLHAPLAADPAIPTLPQLESTDDLLAQAIDNVPPSRRELMLAKRVLLLAQQQGDPAHFEALVRTAMEELPAQG